jgi:hypothetical protein
VVKVGTSKGSTISQHGCSTSGALATGALQKEEEEEEEESKALITKLGKNLNIIQIMFFILYFCIFTMTKQMHN